MLDHVQVLEENGQAKFAVIPFADYLSIKEMLSDEEKLEDYLDYLHMQKVKMQTKHRVNLAEVKMLYAVDEESDA